MEEEAHQVLEAQVVQTEAQMVRMEALVVQEAPEASCQAEGVACPGGGVRAFRGGAWGALASQGACCGLWIQGDFISPLRKLTCCGRSALSFNASRAAVWKYHSAS